MKIFKYRNRNNVKDVCPICKTNKEGKTVLIPILSKRKRYIAEAVQVHLNCLDLWIGETEKGDKFIFQWIVKGH